MGYWEHRKEVACDEEKQQNGAEDAERLDGDAIKGTVSIRSASGRMLAKCVAMWR